MSYKIVHSKPQEFLSRVPQGVIINRFGADLKTIDQQIYQHMSDAINYLTSFAVNVASVYIALGWKSLIFLAVYVYIAARTQAYYLGTLREYKRLMSASKTPVISTVYDTVSGLPHIRNTPNLMGHFRAQFRSAVERSMQLLMMHSCFFQWFDIRCNMYVQIVIDLPAYVLIFTTGISPALVGYLFLTMGSIGGIMNRFMDVRGKLDTTFVAIERCVWFMNEIQIEDGLRVDDGNVGGLGSRSGGRGRGENRPRKGGNGLDCFEDGFLRFGVGGRAASRRLKKFDEARLRRVIKNRFDQRRTARSSRVIKLSQSGSKTKNPAPFQDREAPLLEFSGVSARYVTSSKPVLRDLNFKIFESQRIGIVGRTGSGKSTLVKLLWRYLDPYKGVIRVSGANIQNLNLKSLRVKFNFISQETALFPAPLRENINPTGFLYSDLDMIRALEALGFNNEIFKKEGLDMEIGVAGKGLSHGEKQLVCFARLILDLNCQTQKMREESEEGESTPRKRSYNPPILVLDEATASIDLKTEEAIQNQLFPETEVQKADSLIPEQTTMLIIAHRVQTILKCDLIMVVDKGRIIALESPEELMSRGDGFFKEIVDEMINE